MPDFCQPRAVLMLVLAGLLLALLLALTGSIGLEQFWIRLGAAGLMIETVVLASCLLLCAGRNLLGRLPAGQAYFLIFITIQILTAGFSWLALRWFIAPGTLPLPDDAGLWIGRNVLISAVASLLLLRYLILHRQWIQQVRAEAQARMNELQARIRPHFLFNTLNTIASLIHAKPDQAEQATLDLADLMRTGLKLETTHSLADELELVRGYLRIEALRLGDRLQLKWELDENLPLELQLPPLLLQPLVENAILHGIARSAEGGLLEIKGKRIRFQRIHLTVSNPIDQENRQTSSGSGSALDNIRQRLALAFVEGYGLETRISEGRFQAELTLPTNKGIPD